jgi:hypothetical protein
LTTTKKGTKTEVFAKWHEIQRNTDHVKMRTFGISFIKDRKCKLSFEEQERDKLYSKKKEKYVQKFRVKRSKAKTTEN